MGASVSVGAGTTLRADRGIRTGGRAWSRLVLASVVVLSSMAPVIAAAPRASATYPGVNGLIAFTANLNGRSWQLYSMRSDGTARRQLTHIPGSQDVSFYPDWSPDGRRIVFNSSMSGRLQLYVIRADGTGMRRLFSDPKRDDLLPAWAPDGHTIVFSRVSPITGNAALWKVRADGTDLTRITGARVDHAGAAFTPDGSAILFDRSGDGEIAAIWRVDADGSNPQRLTPAAMRAGLPDISPNGSKVVFYDGQNGQLPNSIWIMNIDGTGLSQLTDAECCYHDVGPVFSPDGTKILFTTDRNYARQCCDELWSMDTDGTHVLELTSDLTAGGCPDDELGNCSHGDWGPLPM
jgi:TolB protein